MVPTLYLFDRFDERLGILPTVGGIAHVEEVGGEDTIEFDCALAPEKGERLLWRDPTDGIWREHVVVRTDEPLGAPAHVYAESSLCELLGDFVEEEQLVAKTASEALAAVLAHTRWAVGDVGVGATERGCLLYHMNALAALRRVEEVWGGEAEAVIAVENGRVSLADGQPARESRRVARGALQLRQDARGVRAHGARGRGLHGALRVREGPADLRRAGRAHGRVHAAADLRFCEQ